MKLINPDLTWYVATCRTGSEERAWLELRAGGIEAYFPRSLRKVFNRRVRVHRTVEEAAIKGHVFLAGPVDWGRLYNEVDNRQREPIEVLGKVYMIPKDFAPRPRFEHVGKPLGGPDGRPLPVPGSVVLQISVDEMAGAYDATGATKKANHEKLKRLFPQGRRLRVRGGHLSGFEAVADAVTAGDRIRALVSILGRMVPIEFDVDELDAA
jgi:hypothetical protein